MFTADAVVGTFHHDLRMNGQGFSFWNVTPDWTTLYKACPDWKTTPCDLSYEFEAFNNSGVSFGATYKGISISDNGNPSAQQPGIVAGTIRWTTLPIQLTTFPPQTGMTVGILVSGHLQAWVGFDRSADPFMDVAIAGIGKLTVWPVLTGPNPPDVIPWALAKAHFTGIAIPVRHEAAARDWHQAPGMRLLGLPSEQMKGIEGVLRALEQFQTVDPGHLNP